MLPTIRKAHVIRCFSDDKSFFVDLLRIDKYVTYSGQGGDWQATVVTLKWMDEGSNGVNQIDGRKITTKKIENPNNKNQTVAVDVIKSFGSVDSWGADGGTPQGIIGYFNNTDKNEGRMVQVVKVVNRTTNSDDLLNAGKNVDAADYMFTGDPNDASFIMVEFVQQYYSNDNIPGDGTQFQEIIQIMKNKMIIQAIEQGQ